MTRAVEITKNLWTFSVGLPNRPPGVTNCYAIIGHERNLIVDTGSDTKQSKADLCAVLEQLEIKPEKTDVFLTHFHPDHIGNARFMESAGCRILISAIDHERFEYDMSNGMRREIEQSRAEGFDETQIQKLLEIWSRDDGLPKRFNATHVGAGSILEYGDYRFTALLTPGHSPGHICLYDERKKILISGDHLLFGITPNVSAFLGVHDSLQDYINSMLAVRELEVELLLPAHKGVTGDYRKRIDEILLHHENRCKSIKDVLVTHQNLSAYSVAQYLPWKSHSHSGWQEFSPIQKLMAVHEISAHLIYLMHKGEINCKRIGTQDVYSI